MPSETGSDTGMSADDAFATLGNETRLEIVRALGKADGPLSFSNLRDRVDVRDSGQFNYHLDNLTGHFVRKTDDGYALRQAGDRVVEAVLSGTVTDAPVVEATQTDEACHHCGSPVAVSYRQEQVDVYCTDCSGAYGETHATGEIAVPDDYGWLGGMPLPPAGVEDRTGEDVLEAAFTLGQTEFIAASKGICPRCSAATDRTIDICDDHDTSDGLCPHCDRRRSVVFSSRCMNCNYETGGGILQALLADTGFLEFVTAHGFNPVAPESVTDYLGAISNYETTVRSRSPAKVELTLTIEGDTFSRTVDEEFLNIDAD